MKKINLKYIGYALLLLWVTGVFISWSFFDLNVAVSYLISGVIITLILIVIEDLHDND